MLIGTYGLVTVLWKKNSVRLKKKDCLKMVSEIE